MGTGGGPSSPPPPGQDAPGRHRSESCKPRGLRGQDSRMWLQDLLQVPLHFWAGAGKGQWVSLSPVVSPAPRWSPPSSLSPRAPLAPPPPACCYCAITPRQPKHCSWPSGSAVSLLGRILSLWKSHRVRTKQTSHSPSARVPQTLWLYQGPVGASPTSGPHTK